MLVNSPKTAQLPTKRTIRKKMTIPIIEKTLLEVTLKNYCNKRIPDYIQHKVKLDFKINKNKSTLFEVRPVFNQPDKTVDIKVAQFRYNTKTSFWTLYCRDRNSIWHKYPGVEPTKRLEDLLEEVESDPTGIFWG